MNQLPDPDIEFVKQILKDMPYEDTCKEIQKDLFKARQKTLFWKAANGLLCLIVVNISCFYLIRRGFNDGYYLWFIVACLNSGGVCGWLSADAYCEWSLNRKMQK